MKRRGIHGPSRCPLCQQIKETIQHLFQDCKFSRECWEKILNLLEVNIEYGKPMLEFLNLLGKAYSYATKRKNTIIRI